MEKIALWRGLGESTRLGDLAVQSSRLFPKKEKRNEPAFDSSEGWPSKEVAEVWRHDSSPGWQRIHRGRAREWRNLLIEYLLKKIKTHYKVNRVAQQQIITDDAVRTPGATLLCGDDPWVLQKENGISYEYNLTTNMFSRGNISEKIRFSKLQVDGEVILDLFCGIGYWVLQMAKHQNPAKIICVDRNPNATAALERNISLNKLNKEIFEIRTDDCRNVKGLNANRIFLGLIPCSCFMINEKTLDLFAKARTSWIHIHHNFTEDCGQKGTRADTKLITSDCLEEVRRSDKIEDLKITDGRESCESENSGLLQLANLFAISLIGKRSDVAQIVLVNSSKVKSYAPHVYHYVFDLEIIWK
ncbi:Oidioi.mRNA.OKI2018_I69.XSR.g16306.t1.cds [Oikopleura dioica]|uniref:Oidioi.mRNA.OKI2018_I69.XSR.g16306.t1.cds n=1 Tax=Oikopleura dioica TaxID=34765 RepID=A0ABN7SKS1_OIKDI|nr:Oidioi.mRNA.OKI2018_I69.XSR.g16306.t1.cds [Oikopleura dioica]